MKETIYDLLSQQGDMAWQQITMHILVSEYNGWASPSNTVK